MALQYITCCVNLSMGDVPDLYHMIDHARRVTYRSAVAKIGRKELGAVFPDYDWSNKPRHLTMRKDWHVAYFRSTFRGKPVYYVKHSAIEYIFGEG
jgi:hypothetical protein